MIADVTIANSDGDPRQANGGSVEGGFAMEERTPGLGASKETVL